MLWLPRLPALRLNSRFNNELANQLRQALLAVSFLFPLLVMSSTNAFSQAVPDRLQNKLAQPSSKSPAGDANFDQQLSDDVSNTADRLAQAEAEIQALKQRLTTPENVFVAPASGAVPEETSSVFEQRFQAMTHKFDELQTKISTPKLPSVEVHGVFQADAGWFGQNAASHKAVGDIQDGADFRRARLSANGAIADKHELLHANGLCIPRPTNVYGPVV